MRSPAYASGERLGSACSVGAQRRAGEWQDNCGRCNMLSIASARPARFRPLLASRARYFFEGNTTVVVQMSQLTDALHLDIDQIGFALPTRNETAQARAEKLNRRISAFLQEVAKTAQDDDFFRSAFDLEPGQEIDLIDPELFVFPDRTRKS